MIRQFRRLADWTSTVPDSPDPPAQFIGGYNATTNLVEGGGFDTQPLPAASTVEIGQYFMVTAGGTLNTPNAPEITGKVVAGNDNIVASSTGYVVVTATTAFLSKQIDDTAAGKITFAAGAASSVAPVGNDDLTRKSYIDTHTNDVTIHFADVLADDVYYVRRNRQWVTAPPIDLGVLHGATDNFTMTTGPSVLQNYAGADASGTLVGNVHDTSGLIVVPEAAIYRVTAWVVGLQSSDTKEETMRLNLRIVNTVSLDGDHPMWAFDVATDKTDERSFMFSRVMSLPQMAFLFLSMDATANMGNFTVVDTTFELERLDV